MWYAMRNIKWQIILFSVIYTLTASALAAAAWFVFKDRLDLVELIWTICGILTFASLVFGYLFAQRLQRRMDRLQFGMIQLSRGNFASRLRPTGFDPFDSLFREFNELAAALEDKVQLLQQLGEAEARASEDEEKAVLEERRRLARDLHDTVSQQLFAMHMHASSLPMVLERNPDQAKGILDQLVSMSQLAQKQIRGLIAQLRPLELEGRTLSEALEQWFPDYCRHNHLKGTLDIRLEGRMSEVKEQQLFMIIQEAMANIVKHASADAVQLTLMATGSSYVMQIGDNGVGFDSELTRQHSYGLASMKERARKLGGQFELSSKQGAGTRLKVIIPRFAVEQAGGESKHGNLN